MRILLTGAQGQVGGALLPLLDRIGTVHTPSRAEFDLSKPEALRRTLDEIEPNLIVNPAAHTAVDRAEGERDLAFLVNAKGPEAIARWASARRIPMIHFSTDYVFDGSGDQARSENSLPKPLSVYGASKLAGDTAIAESGVPHLIFRTSWVYAAQGANFLRTVARLAGERRELRIVSDQIGAPTTARSIADAAARILRDNLGALDGLFESKGGVVNLVCAGETSWHGFAEAIVDGLRSRGLALSVEAIHPIQTSEFPTKAARPANSRLDLNRLRDSFGVTMPNWRDALSTELDEYVRLQALCKV